MRKTFAAALLAAALLPVQSTAQESEISRRTYTFLNDRLVINVLGHAPGELQLVRGEPGRVEVAARSRDGFPGFGLGGTITRELRLTAVGAEQVRFLVVIPERVRVTVRLPNGGASSVTSFAGSASYTWGETDAEQVELPLAPTTAGGLYIAHATAWAPALVDVPDLAAVRTLAVRFEGSEFRIAASRPLAVATGRNTRIELRISGEPLDLVIYVPRSNAGFQLRSGTLRLAESIAGRPRALCGNVMVQRPTPNQDWLTFYPRDGTIECR